MSPILELRRVVKEFGSQRAVDKVSLSLAPGRFYSLLGPSGCGKTTTLRLVAGFEKPDEGEVLLQGERVNDRPAHQRNVSTVFQNYALFPHLTVDRNVAFGLEQRGARAPRAKVAEALEMVRLTGKEKRFPAQLSGGEKQRVALARSVVLRPDVLLLDEPLAALDLQLRRAMRFELKALQRHTGLTFLFVTHDQEEALALSDEIAILNRGRLEQIGSPRDVYEHPASRFVAGFLGAMNWFGEIGIRPEALRISRNGGPRRATARVTESVFLGSVIQLKVRLNSGEDAVAELPPTAGDFRCGEEVALDWSPADELKFAE